MKHMVATYAHLLAAPNGRSLARDTELNATARRLDLGCAQR
jgi:hypothetical protein